MCLFDLQRLKITDHSRLSRQAGTHLSPPRCCHYKMVAEQIGLSAMLATHPYAVIRVEVVVSFRENGVWLNLHDVVVSLLRQKTPID